MDSLGTKDNSLTFAARYAADEGEIMRKHVKGYFIKRRNVATQLSIPGHDKAGVLKAINAIRALFGKNGDLWTKGSYRQIKNGMLSFCLIGAAKQANGKYENAARAAIGMAVLHKTKGLDSSSPPGIIADECNVTEWNDKNQTKWQDVLSVLRLARKLIKEA